MESAGLIPFELFSDYSIDDITTCSFPCRTLTSPCTIKFLFMCTFTQSLWEESRLLEPQTTSLMRTNVSVPLDLFRRYSEASAIIKDQMKHLPIPDHFFEILVANAHEQAEEALNSMMPPIRVDLYVQCHVIVVHRIVLQPIPATDFLEDRENISSNCCICLEDLSSESAASSMPCQHVFHRDCIVKWLGITRSCPLCRFQIP